MNQHVLTIDRCTLTDDTPGKLSTKNDNVLYIEADEAVKNGLEEHIWFYACTYSNISRNLWAADSGEPAYVTMLSPANDVLASLSLEEKQRVYRCLYRSKQKLKTMTDHNRLDILNEIGDMWTKEIIAMEIDRKAIAYVENSNIQIPESSKDHIDKPHHTREMTYMYDDYVQVIAISVIVKILIPILGEAVERTRIDVANSRSKETYASIIIQTILNDSPYLRESYDKLYNYILQTVDREERNTFREAQWNTPFAYNINQTQYSYALNGFTYERACHVILAQVLVKKLATINYYLDEKSNIMRFLHESITKSHDSLIKGFNQRRTGNKRDPMVRKDGGDGDDSSSRMDDDTTTTIEQSSRVSDQPADRPVFINATIGIAIEKYLKSNGHSLKDHKKACGHYAQNLHSISPLTNTLVASHFGYMVGGAKGLRYLTLLNYIPLLAATQMVLAKQGYVDVVHLISATSHTKTEPFTSLESSIVNNYKVSREYNQCLTLYPYALGKVQNGLANIGIRQQLHTILNWLTQNTHKYNTASTIQKYINEETLPEWGMPIVYHERIMTDICQIILEHHQE